MRMIRCGGQYYLLDRYMKILKTFLPAKVAIETAEELTALIEHLRVAGLRVLQPSQKFVAAEYEIKYELNMLSAAVVRKKKKRLPVRKQAAESVTETA